MPNQIHPMFKRHCDDRGDGWKIMLFGIACGILIAVAFAFTIGAGT